jgi:C-terminal processing protease CtpA/Prc
VTLLCSYLLGPQPVHFCDIRWREPGGSAHGAGGQVERIEPSWTLPEVPGLRYAPDRPMYLLTSQQTFSAAEAVAFCLQNRKRATVIGERTGGGAHLSSGILLSADFGLSVPTGRAVDPLTGTNWEGTGVVPDIEVTAAEALAVAHAATLRQVLAVRPATSTAPNKALRTDAARTLSELERRNTASRTA